MTIIKKEILQNYPGPYFKLAFCKKMLGRVKLLKVTLNTKQAFKKTVTKSAIRKC